MAKTAKAKKIIERVKKKNTPEKRVFTFRLREALIEDFRAACERDRVSTADVLEELIRDFIGDKR